MEAISKQKVLDSIGKIYEEAKESKLEESLFETVDEELNFLSSYFQTTKNQAFFISLIFALNYKGHKVDISDISDYLFCNPMKVLRYSEDIEYLESKGILIKEKSRPYMELAIVNNQYTIHKQVSEAILKSLPIPEIIQAKIEDIVGLLEELYNLGQQRDDEIISTKQLFYDARKLLTAYAHFPLIKKVHQFKYSMEDTFLFLYLTWKTIAGSQYVDISRALTGIYDNSSKRMRHMQDLLAGNNILVENNLIEIMEAGFFNDTQMKLTDNSLELLDECDIKLFIGKKKKKENIISPAEIVPRELIFDPKEMSQLNLIGNLLQEDKLKETQERLTQKGMPKGVTILLHGAPGTGKTEIVKQLAKQTDREILKVDISASKSMWFGESEKLIKKIFTDYTAYSKVSKRTPILLFNEADALISKRKDIDQSSSGQTQNAIQNILLEELENFEGILMATTNLVDNLDSAFDRRFLFKVEFKKPSISSRAKIWKMKLPMLETMECEWLAEAFDFSGGQIDNIVRKNEIQEIVNGTQTSYESIVSFCKEESLSVKLTTIGFNQLPN